MQRKRVWKFKPNPKDWADLIEFDPEFNDEFNMVFNNKDISKVDNYTQELLEDTYINMELAIPKGQSGSSPEFARVAKILRGANGMPIGTINSSHLLDTHIYKVKYTDGYKAYLTANSIAMNMFAQVDDEGNMHDIFDSIVSHRNDGSNIKEKDSIIKSKNGGHRRKKATKGWEMLVMLWSISKDMKEYYPIKVSEYSFNHR